MRPVDLIGIENMERLRAAGFVIAPKEPTEEMMQAGAHEYMAARMMYGTGPEDMGDIYRAMIATSQEPKP